MYKSPSLLLNGSYSTPWTARRSNTATDTQYSLHNYSTSKATLFLGHSKWYSGFWSRNFSNCMRAGRLFSLCHTLWISLFCKWISLSHLFCTTWSFCTCAVEINPIMIKSDAGVWQAKCSWAWPHPLTPTWASRVGPRTRCRHLSKWCPTYPHAGNTRGIDRDLPK